MDTPAENSKELRQKILFKLDNKAMTRAELCAELKIPFTTMWDNLGWLDENGFVEPIPMETHKRGRPPKEMETGSATNHDHLKSSFFLSLTCKITCNFT